MQNISMQNASPSPQQTTILLCGEQKSAWAFCHLRLEIVCIPLATKKFAYAAYTCEWVKIVFIIMYW